MRDTLRLLNRTAKVIAVVLVDEKDVHGITLRQGIFRPVVGLRFQVLL
jgi:hypothetical protein